MSRITSRGRNSWTATNTRRCHSIDIHGPLQPMDTPRRCVPPVAWLVAVVALIAIGVMA